jgi:hypothetical protein
MEMEMDCRPRKREAQKVALGTVATRSSHFLRLLRIPAKEVVVLTALLNEEHLRACCFPFLFLGKQRTVIHRWMEIVHDDERRKAYRKLSLYPKLRRSTVSAHLED